MSKEFISIPQEKANDLHKLDKAAEKIYDLSESLARFIKIYRKYLPKQSDGRRMMLAELLETEKIEDLIDWSALEEEAKSAELSSIQKKARRAKILHAFKAALETQKNLSRCFQDELEISAKAEEHLQIRKREYALALKKLQQLALQEKESESVLDCLTAEAGSPTEDLAGAMEDQRAEIMAIRTEREEFINEHPEAYYIDARRMLSNMKESFDKSGRIVETPYVKEKIKHVLENVEVGSPVFIHGELGSGKSELARYIARTRLSKPFLARWEKLHPRPDGADKKTLIDWEAEKERNSEAIEISGHRGMEAEPLLAERTIALRKVPTPREQVEAIEFSWQKAKAEILDRMRKEGVKSTDVKIKEYEKIYVEAFLQSFRNPIETRRVLGPLFRAMQEGRPLIIDEMNAIPHHVLIVMNDYLMRRPGEAIAPPFVDVEPFKVREGFSVLATGNYKPEDGAMYAGRQKMDAAFLSRFGVVQYDYLPEKREIEPEGLSIEDQRSWRRENELLMMLATRLMDSGLSLTIPKNSWAKLEKLAMTARAIQDIFSEAEMSETWYTEKGAKPKEVLKENVLSIRHLLRLVDMWAKDGYRYPLDVYLYRQFVERSKGSRPEEMVYLYQKLQIVGDFFPVDDGWPNTTEGGVLTKLNALKIEELKEKLDKAPPIKRETFSSRQMIEKIFGPPPKRKIIAQEMFGLLEKDEDKEKEDKLENARISDFSKKLNKLVLEMRDEDFGDDFSF